MDEAAKALSRPGRPLSGGISPPSPLPSSPSSSSTLHPCCCCSRRHPPCCANAALELAVESWISWDICGFYGGNGKLLGGNAAARLKTPRFESSLLLPDRCGYKSPAGERRTTNGPLRALLSSFKCSNAILVRLRPQCGRRTHHFCVYCRSRSEQHLTRVNRT